MRPFVVTNSAGLLSFLLLRYFLIHSMHCEGKYTNLTLPPLPLMDNSKSSPAFSKSFLFIDTSSDRRNPVELKISIIALFLIRLVVFGFTWVINERNSSVVIIFISLSDSFGSFIFSGERDLMSFSDKNLSKPCNPLYLRL